MALYYLSLPKQSHFNPLTSSCIHQKHSNQPRNSNFHFSSNMRQQHQKAGLQIGLTAFEKVSPKLKRQQNSQKLFEYQEYQHQPFSNWKSYMKVLRKTTRIKLKLMIREQKSHLVYSTSQKLHSIYCNNQIIHSINCDLLIIKIIEAKRELIPSREISRMLI